MLALVVLSAAYCLYNPNTLKPLASYLTERFLDRTLDIDGDLTLEVSWQPRVSGTGVRFGNAPGASAPYMATAEYALVKIDLKALFSKHVHLLDLDIHGAELNLEDAQDGRPNWRFFEESENDPEWTFMIEGLNVTGSKINADIGELSPIELTIPELKESSDPEGNLHLDGHGLLNGDAWMVKGLVGPFDELLVAGRIELDLDLMIDDAEIKASGHIGDLASLSELDLELAIHGPDADVLGEIFRMTDAFKEDIALKASIRPQDGGHTMSIQGHISDFEIETAGTVTDLNNLDGWDGFVAIRGPEAGVFGKALQIDGFPEGPFRVDGTLHLHGGDLDLENVVINTADIELVLNADFEDFPKREGAFGTFHMSGPDISQFSRLLRLPSLPQASFDLELTLDATGNEVLTSSFRVGPHTLSVAGRVGEFPDYHGTRLVANLTGDDIATVLRVTGMEQPLAGPYEAGTVLSLDPSGLTLSEFQIHMDGHTLRGAVHWPESSEPDRFDVEMALELENLAETAALFGAADLPTGPLTAEATIQARKNGFELNSSKTVSQSLLLTANGQLGSLRGLEGLDLSIDLTGPSVDRLFNNALPNDGRAAPFSLHAGIRGRERAIELDGFELTTEGGAIRVDGQIALNPDFSGSVLVLQGHGRNLSALVPDFPGYSAPEKPWQLHVELGRPDAHHLSIRDGRLSSGSVQLSLSGLLDFGDYSETHLSFQASGDRIVDLGQIGDIPWPVHAFSLSTELEGTLNSIQIKDLKANWGQSDLQGRGNVELSGKPRLTIEGNSQTLDIIDLQHALFGDPEDIDQTDDSDTFFADKPIPIDYLQAFDADLDIKVGVFRGQRSTLHDIDLALNVQDGGLELERAAFRDDVGYFDAHGILRPIADGVYTEMVYTGEEVDLGLFVAADQPRESVPRYSLNVDVSGSGQTVAEIAGNLNGTVLISSDGGQINNDLLNAFAGDFLSNVLEVLNPFVVSEEFTDMSCMVVNAGIQDGQMKLEPGIVMRTDRLNMFVYGGINLATEAFDLSLATQARRGIGISAASITNPYFKVGGTLANPALELDPASAAIAASVATATAGLSILIRGVWDRLMGTRNPCPDFLKYEQKVLTERSAEAAPATEQG